MPDEQRCEELRRARQHLKRNEWLDCIAACEQGIVNCSEARCDDWISLRMSIAAAVVELPTDLRTKHQRRAISLIGEVIRAEWIPLHHAARGNAYVAMATVILVGGSESEPVDLESVMEPLEKGIKFFERRADPKDLALLISAKAGAIMSSGITDPAAVSLAIESLTTARNLYESLDLREQQEECERMLAWFQRGTSNP